MRVSSWERSLHFQMSFFLALIGTKCWPGKFRQSCRKASTTSSGRWKTLIYLQEMGPNGCLHHCRHFHSGCPSLKPLTCTAGNTPCLWIVLTENNIQEGSFDFQGCWEIWGQSLACVCPVLSPLFRISFLGVATERCRAVDIFGRFRERFSAWEGLPVADELLSWVLLNMVCSEPSVWHKGGLCSACPQNNIENISGWENTVRLPCSTAQSWEHLFCQKQVVGLTAWTHRQLYV